MRERPRVVPGPAIWSLALLALAVAACGTVEYNVPAGEVQRLAELPPATRGDAIRVVPRDAPALAAPAAAPVADVVAPPPDQPGVVVGVSVGGPGPIVRPPPPVVRAPPIRAPVVRAPPVRAVPIHAAPVHGGSIHGGGGGGRDAAIVALIVLPILVAALVADAREQAAEAAAFDGWVTVPPTHVLRLRYVNAAERAVSLAALTPWDLVGLRYAVLREDDGPVRRGWVAVPGM